jgi:type II secretory ATPase GspE/PulE/Tfp pilus assembly ATPase PilB-like protein
MSVAGQILVDQGLLSAEDLALAHDRSASLGMGLMQSILDVSTIEERAILESLASQQGIPFLELRNMDIPDSAVKALSSRMVSHYQVIPVRNSGSLLLIATSDPFDVAALDDIQATLGIRVDRAFACRQDVEEAIRKHYGLGADTVEQLVSGLGGTERLLLENEFEDLEKLADDASVVKLVNQFLRQAIQDRATDLHLEISRGDVVIRRRVDGLLYDTQMPRELNQLYPAIVSRIKLMAGLDIVEKRLPQDGRSRVRIGSAEYDLRVSVVPSLHGENVVIRILPTTMLFSMSDLGMNNDDREVMENLISKPHGIIMVTGPTGSGKSTTLYACLSKLNTRERKLITIEDPVEYELRGVTQTQINPGIGLSFSAALRSMLRHDPDVMMVGEIRDRETAEITIQTALTGHLVLSTLHTNDAASAAVRLIDMGIDPYLVTSTVLAFVAQRLVRKICTHCKESYVDNGETYFRGAGCHKCNQSGYHGRLAIYEFLPLHSELRDLVLKKSPASIIREKADMLNFGRLFDDGMSKARQGVTTVEEVMRVCYLDA